ncbi:hypothetical protein CEP53_004284 [Fusarium sp. AF-6]|nr:hypothetical protein CEP53_004284 [Fusarium sp. AF-6]
MSGSFSAYDQPFNLLPLLLYLSVFRHGPIYHSSCRCHAQKLRCVKRKDTSACQRCLNLDTLCRFSPRASRIYARNRQREADFGRNGRRALAELVAAPSGVSSDLASSTGASSPIWPLNTSDMIDTSDAQGLYLDLCSPIQGVVSSGTNALMWPGISHDINLLDINNPTDFDPTSFADIGLRVSISISSSTVGKLERENLQLHSSLSRQGPGKCQLYRLFSSKRE